MKGKKNAIAALIGMLDVFSRDYSFKVLALSNLFFNAWNFILKSVVE